MIRINKLKSNVRIHDAAMLGSRIYNELNQSGIEDAHIDTIKAETNTFTSSLKAVVDENKNKSLLDASDDRRDNTYRALLYLNKGYLLHPNETIREAALAVDQVLATRGFDLTNLNYTAQSEATNALIRDFKSETLSPKVALLPSMSELVVQLEADELSFQNTQKEWLDAKADDQMTLSASAHKRELLKVINDKMVTYLRAMQQMNPEPYQALISKIVLLIDEANELIRSRQKEVEN